MNKVQIANAKESKAMKSKPTGRRNRISAVQQQYYKAIGLADAALGAAVSASKTGGTGEHFCIPADAVGLSQHDPARFATFAGEFSFTTTAYIIEGELL